jgi:hypothetical protein
MRNRQNMFFFELEHKKMLKIVKCVKNVLRQHQILLICLLVPIIDSHSQYRDTFPLKAGFRGFAF